MSLDSGYTHVFSVVIVPYPAAAAAVVVRAGVEPTVFEYLWDGARAGWVPWVQLVPEYVHRPELQFNQILVPTVDTVRTTWILDLLVNRQCAVRP